MLAKVRATIQKYQLLTGGERIIVGFSGGIDSLCLLHLLWRMTDYRLDLWALYINYGLRPVENLREESLLKQVGAQWGIKTKMQIVNLPERLKQKQQSLQLLAREERFRIFKDFLKEIQADKVALAHHRDDQVETVLYRIIRGTGIDGLAGIPVSRAGMFIRPLLEVSRAEIKEYAQKHNLIWVEDSSNQKLIYRRNQIRHQLIPDIESSFNRQFKESLLRLSKLAGEQRSLMEELVVLRLPDLIIPAETGKVGFKLRPFLEAHPYLQYYLLKEFLFQIAPDGQFESKMLLKLRDQIQGGTLTSKKIQLTKRIDVYQENGVVFFATRPEPVKANSNSYPVHLPGTTDLSVVKLKLIIEPAPVPASWDQVKENEIYVNPVQLQEPLKVRFWRPGDSFRPLGTRGSQKLHDFFINQKIPRAERNGIPLLVTEDDRIIWIIGRRLSDDFRVKAETSEVWHIIAESPSI
ncbi:MAG TPA: tRNA lysidine(34) synthetase TilS [Bacillota bacterium]|nr:tRNA lysidine(34) synthetase TilS [Bacillota bacterium]